MGIKINIWLGFLVVFLLAIPLGTSTWPITCNQNGSAGSDNVVCNDSAMLVSETWICEGTSNATMDSCRDGSDCDRRFGNVYDIAINTSDIFFGSKINVTCNAAPRRASTRGIGIAYNNGSGWKLIYNSTFYTDLETNHTNVSVKLNVEEGNSTQYVRCIVVDNTSAPTETCGSDINSKNSDTDDLDFEVLANPWPITCNQNGSAGLDNVACNGSKEGTSNATLDSCYDVGDEEKAFNVENILINSSNISPGDNVKVRCDFLDNKSGGFYGILYNNGSGWTSLINGSSPSREYSIDTSIVIDNANSTQYFRCIFVGDGEANSTLSCGSNGEMKLSDTDDIDFTLSGNVAPSYSLNSPNNGKYVNETDVVLNVTVLDSNQDLIDVYFYNSSGGEIKNYTNVSSGAWVNVTLESLSEDTHEWYVNVTDGNLTTRSETWNFTVDTILPSVKINSPEEDSNFSTITVRINATSTDLNLNYSNVSLLKGDSVIDSAVNETNGTYILNLTGAGDFSYNITVTSYDLAGNFNISTVTNITLAPLNWPPSEPTLNYPFDGGYVNETTVKLNLTLLDPDGNTMNVSFFNASSNSELCNNVSISNGSYVVCEWSSLSEDTHEWYVNVTDGNLTTRSETWNFTVDTTNATISIASPTDDDTINSKTIDVFFRVIEENFNYTNVSLEKNSNIIDSLRDHQEGSYHHVYLTASGLGAHNITVTSYDLAGNVERSEVFNINVSSPPPKILGINTSKNEYVEGETVIFSSSVNDSNGDIVALLVSEDSNFTDCNYSVRSGCIAYSDNLTTTGSQQELNATSRAIRNTTWYARVCDNGNLCDNIIGCSLYNGACSQEFTDRRDNSSQQTNKDEDPPVDGNCSLGYSGTYSKMGWNGINNETHDGNWSTYSYSNVGAAELNITYELPECLDNEGSRWIVSDYLSQPLGGAALRLPRDCIGDYFVRFKIISLATLFFPGQYNATFYCYNYSETGWIMLRNIGSSNNSYCRVFEEKINWRIIGGSLASGNFSVVNHKPKSLLNEPLNNSYINALYTQLNVTLVDPGGDNMNVTFYEEETDNEICSITEVNNGSSVNCTYIGLTDGANYSWYVNVTDNESAINKSSIYTFNVDTTYPKIFYSTGILPNDTHTFNEWIYVNVSVEEDNEANITFDLYTSSGISESETYYDETYEINWTSLSAGRYWYNVTVYDLAGNSNTTSLNFLNLEDSCNPSPNEDWNIYLQHICDNKNVNIGTGSINILANGKLTLVNSANVTANGISINRSGDSVFINQGCKLKVN